METDNSSDELTLALSAIEGVRTDIIRTITQCQQTSELFIQQVEQIRSFNLQAWEFLLQAIDWLHSGSGS